MIICAECGYVAKCTVCDAALNYHKADDLLKCHYCGGKYQLLEKCPKCGCENIRRSGTGTQKVCDEIKKLFPRARTLRMDIDTTQNKEAHLKITRKFADRQADILVGTQMIAKGHDFPSVTLVGVLDADLSLYFSDYRSIERTFSLITQVAGRAGRAEKEGEVIVQTRTPSHYVYKIIRNYDYKGFYDREISLRKAANYPPFAKILRVLCMGENEDTVKEVTKNIYNAVKELSNNYQDKFIYLNAMKAPVSKIKNKYRYQILARVADETDKICGFVYDIVDVCRNKSVISYLEINPSSMY
jgi:primosomal protein N' (replication factor Y)